MPSRSDAEAAEKEKGEATEKEAEKVAVEEEVAEEVTEVAVEEDVVKKEVAEVAVEEDVVEVSEEKARETGRGRKGGWEGSGGRVGMCEGKEAVVR